MADVDINKFRASVVRDGSKPASPGFIVSEGQSPTDPAGSGQNHLPVTIAEAATGLSITESQVLGGAGTVGQYIRGDGSLADFPESSGGGSSVSYYLNGSVAQGTIGGVAYKELNKVPILGAGTDFTINADGYIASFITDAGDPNLLEIPGGNWNFETYFSASSGGGTPTFYVELYKVNSGGTATLIASNSTFPELIAFGTNIISYFSTLAVPTTALALTDRLAIRYYVTHSGRTITLHTEDNHLCQIVTTFTTGLTALNGLTAQIQNFAVGTSGTDFAIASATATHTFNLPTASATNRGALSSTDWSTFNSKQNALTLTTTGSSGAATLVGSTLNIPNYSPDLSGYVPTSRTITINGTTQDLSANRTFNVGDMLLDTIQTVTARKDYNSNTLQLVVNGTSQKTILTNSPIDTGSYSGLINAFGFNASNNLYFSKGANNNGIFAFSNAATRTYTLKDASGTLAFTSDIPSLSGYVQGSGTTNYLPKFTGASTIGNSQIFDNGTNVGIGTASPNNLLTIIGNDPSQVSIEASSGNTNSQINLKPSGTGIAYIKNQANTGFAFGTNNTEAMRLSSSGNLLVGTTTDNGARLQVSGTATVSGNGLFGGTTAFSGLAGGIAVNGSTNSGINFRIADVLRGYVYVAGNLGMYVESTAGNVVLAPTGNAALTATSSGNVGIGTASPNLTAANRTVLDINGTNNSLLVFSSGGTYKSYIYNDGVGLTLQAATLQFETSFVPRIHITSGGNVLIGTTTDAGQKLQVTGNLLNTVGNNVLVHRVTGATTGYIYGYWTNTSGQLLYGVEGSTPAQLQTGSSAYDAVITTASTSSLSIGVNQVQAIKIVNGGNVLIGSATNTAGVKLRVAGGIIGCLDVYNNTTGAAANLQIDTNGFFARSTSSIKYKKNVKNYNKGLIEVMQLRPVLYEGKSESDKGKIYAGLIAEEVHNLGLTEFVQYATDGSPDALSYQNMISLLTKAIQELKQEIDTLKN